MVSLHRSDEPNLETTKIWWTKLTLCTKVLIPRWKTLRANQATFPPQIVLWSCNNSSSSFNMHKERTRNRNHYRAWQQKSCCSNFHCPKSFSVWHSRTRSCTIGFSTLILFRRRNFKAILATTVSELYYVFFGLSLSFTHRLISKQKFPRFSGNAHRRLKI